MPSADIAWILTCTALVLFMTLPGLAIFYGGLVRSKNVLSVLMHCFIICATASVAWMMFGYSIAFGSNGNTLWGGFNEFFLFNIARDPENGISDFLTVVFQMTFAIITPALIIGAIVERVKFGFLIAFTILWGLVVYAPVAHWVWGGGLLSDASPIGFIKGLGVQDLAGGVVVHVTAGVAALVLVMFLGPRSGFPQQIRPPHQPALVMIGASMLWVGWFGFNGGSPFGANNAAISAILVTHLSASAACVTWIIWEKIQGSQATLIGIVTAMVAGLASITPAAGHVGPIGALIIGAVAGILCQEMILVIKNRFKLDDSLDVFAVHGIGGIWGTLALPFLANTSIGGAGLADGVGVWHQFFVQLAGVAIVALFTAVLTAGLVLAIKAVLGMRASEEEIRIGLDLSAHGERAYHLSDV